MCESKDDEKESGETAGNGNVTKSLSTSELRRREIENLRDVSLAVATIPEINALCHVLLDARRLYVLAKQRLEMACAENVKSEDPSQCKAVAKFLEGSMREMASSESFDAAELLNGFEKSTLAWLQMQAVVGEE